MARIDPSELLALPEWLRQFGMLVAGDLPMDDARERMRSYGDALRSDFAPTAFTAASARHVARHANAKGFFPRYPEVCTALTEWARTNPAGTRPLPSPAAASPGHAPGPWRGFIARRMLEGADRAHLLSLARRYAAPGELQAILAAHFAAELRAEDQHAAAVTRDKALAAARASKLLAATMAPPKVAKSTPPPPPPTDAAKPVPRPLTPEAMLAGLERAIAAGQATEATKTRAAALRQQIGQARQEAAA